MNNKEILGLESALDEAKSKPMQNMVISCNLVVEIIEEIERLDSELADMYNTVLSHCGDNLEGEIDIGDIQDALNKNSLQQQSKGIQDAAGKLNASFLRGYNNGHIDSEAWSQWCRVLGALNDEARSLTKQSRGE